MKTFSDVPTSQMAKYLKVSQAYVSNMKAGRTAIPHEVALKVSEYFGVPLWEIRPDIYPRKLFEANDASNHNNPPRPIMEGANE